VPYKMIKPPADRMRGLIDVRFETFQREFNIPCNASCSPKLTCDMKYCSLASIAFGGGSSFRTVSSAARNSSVVIPLVDDSASFDCATLLSTRFLSLPALISHKDANTDNALGHT
jgi:hypothetical protein